MLETTRSIVSDISQYIWRYVTFAPITEAWSPLSATERAERHASWPAWRRAVRPIGTILYWPGIVWFAWHSDHKTSQFFALFAIWLAVMLALATIGIRDWTRARSHKVSQDPTS